jgi:C4-dicarboxylate transporter DctM subunit
MDGSIIGFLSLAVVLGLIAVGIPVAISILSVTAVGMYVLLGDSFLFTTFETTVWATSTKYSFAVIPMFILMGEFAGGTRIITDLYNACYRWLGGMRGGVYNSTVLASAGFAAISGSTIVNAAVFTRVALPEIDRLGYHRGFGAGCIAASGTLAAMIPPSLTIVLFGFLTDQSIGALLIAGILPGTLTAIMLMFMVWVSVVARPQLAPKTVDHFTLREKITSLWDIWPVAVLATIVLSGIYTGTVSPSAAGTVGAMGALLIALIKRRMTLAIFWQSIKRTAIISSSLFLIIIAGLLFSRMLLFSGAVSDLTTYMTASGFTPFTFMACVVIGFFIFGMFIDPVTMMVISIPFLYPAVLAMGLNPIWFGIIIVKLIEIAAITPPIGINLFAVMSASDGKVTGPAIFKGVLPFVLMELCVLGLLLAFPAIATLLPSLM